MDLFKSTLINIFVKSETKGLYSLVILQEKDNTLPYDINRIVKNYKDSNFHIGDEVLFTVNKFQIECIAYEVPAMKIVFKQAGLV